MWLKARAARRYRCAVPERLYHSVQRLQGPELHRTGAVGTEDGQAHIYRCREDERDRTDCRCCQKAGREAQHRHTYQAGFKRIGQMAGERWRRLEVRTALVGAAPGARNTRRQGAARLCQTHPFPHRIADNQDTTHSDCTARGCQLLRTAAQDGLQHRLRRLWRWPWRRLRRNTLVVERELGQLLYPGVCQRLRVHIRRCFEQERHQAS